MKQPAKILGQAMVLTVVASTVGFAVNLLRPEGLPWIAKEPYDLYRPCPVVTREAPAVRPQDLPGDLSDLILVDARTATEFEEGHARGAWSLPYDPLRSPAADRLERLRTSRAAGILVVGDTEIDSGRLLGAELVEAGLRGVRYLQGGYPAWVEAGRPVVKGGAR